MNKSLKKPKTPTRCPYCNKVIHVTVTSHIVVCSALDDFANPTGKKNPEGHKQ